MTASRKWFNPHSIFAKIAGLMAVSIGMIGLALTIGSHQSTDQLLRRGVLDRATAEAELIASLIAAPTKFGKADIVTGVLTETMQNTGGQNTGALVLGVDGQVLAEAGDAQSNDAADVALGRKALELGASLSSDDGYTVAAPVRYGADQATVGAFVTRWTPEVVLAQQQDSLTFTLAVAGIAFLVTMAGTLFLFGRIVLRPLHALRTAILGLTGRDYATPIPGQARKDEIGQIAQEAEVPRLTLAEAAGAQQDALFKSAAFMGSSAAMMLVDESFTIRAINPKLAELFRTHADFLAARMPDFKLDSIVGTSFETFHHRAQAIRAQVGRLGAGGFAAVMPFGEARISLKASAIRNPDGSAAGHVLEWADITQDSFNGAIIEAIENGQIRAEFDPQGQLSAANPLFCRGLDLPVETLRTLRLKELVRPGGALADPVGADAGAALLARVLAEGKHLGHLTFRSRAGRELIVDGSLSVVRDGDGHVFRLLLIGKDVTESEAQLRVARAERAEAEAQQTRVVEALRVGLRSLAAGDLTARIEEPFAGGYEDLRIDYNNTVQNLANALREIAENSENIRNEARDISTTADGLSRRTENTAATLEQTAAALDELTSAVRGAAEGAARADRAVIAATANAEDSGKVVLKTVAAMDQISESSDRITSIIKVIDDIAFQTNLLALNAGVEAARAGDAGRGFAVVASEVRAPAQRSSDAAREINGLIAQSGGQVKRGVDLVGKTGQALRQIVDSVSEISTLVSEIASSSRQQSTNLAEINAAVNQLDQSTQQNAARLEETTAASEALRNDAVALVGTVSHFVLPDSVSTDGAVLAFRGRPKEDARADAPAPRPRTKAPLTPARAPAATAEEIWQDF